MAGRGHTCSRSHNCYRNLNNAVESKACLGFPSLSCLSVPAYPPPSSLRNGLGLITGRCTAQNHHHNLNEHTQNPPTAFPSNYKEIVSLVISLLTSSVFVICRLHLESSVHLQKRKKGGEAVNSRSIIDDDANLRRDLCMARCI